MTVKNPIREFKLPQIDYFKKLITETIKSLKTEDSFIRPQDETGLPGALIDLYTDDKPIPTIIVPDLHARLDFFEEILALPICVNKETKEILSIDDALQQNKVYLLCLGDGLHSEYRGKERWIKAEELWQENHITNKYLCEEMYEGLSLMTRVMETKCKYPENFHFLRGNHENILNQFFCGAMPFRKFACEGEMVRDFMIEVYGQEITEKYADFEHNLPLFAKGKNFLASHAEPVRAYTKHELIDGFLDEDLIRGLTWTANDQADENSVETMLENLLPKEQNALYFAGHRTIQETHKLLRNRKFIQIHNQKEHFISIIQPNRVFDPLQDIYDTKTGKIAQVTSY